ncbi:MAG: arginine N-succinyltransferase [Aquificaceae bacterium]|nr:MAG: arginine N-succinyltransferase [Aquificaceae bacterium]
MQEIDNTRDSSPQKQGRGCLATLGLMLLTVIISVGLTTWLITVYLFPKNFDPVELSSKEETVLESKLNQFGFFGLSKKEHATKKENSVLVPEKYTEHPEKREIALSEKELNALLAKNTDLAQKLAIDLSDDLASAKLIIPLDPDFPFFGGKTLKVTAGMELAYQASRPIVILKGVSVWGVPIPNAWLGNLKNVDLVKEFGGDEGFWKSFADGIDNIHVEDNQLRIKLKE